MFERRREKNVSLRIRRVCHDVCKSKSTRLARRGSPYFREIRGTSCRSRVTSLQRLSSQRRRRRPLSDSTSVPRTENEGLSLTLDGDFISSRVYKQRESPPLNRRMLSRCGKRHLIFNVLYTRIVDVETQKDDHVVTTLISEFKIIISIMAQKRRSENMNLLNLWVI